MTRAIMLAAGAFLVFCGTAGAQSAAASPHHTGPAATAPKQPTTTTTPAAATARSAASQAKTPSLQGGADKLVDLAQQLKTEVDKSNGNTLSLNMLRRAGEIEKLAKDLEKQLQSAKR